MRDQTKVQDATGRSRAVLHQRFPTIEDLRRRARRRIPGFSFAYVDGGVGLDTGVERNAASFGAVELVPRYGIDPETVSTEVELFGRRYAAPIGIAPMGFPGLIWPGAEESLARAAQQARIPLEYGVVGGRTIERVAELAPEVFWFQLYRFAANDHAIGLDLVRRADDAGAHVLVLTLDVPSRAKRPRELRQGVVFPFRPGARAIFDVVTSPSWLASLLRNGAPRFANFAPYIDKNISASEMATFIRRNMGGGFSWEEVARYRDRWRGPLVLKGILHPLDAEKAVSLGIDGIQVSNHGGRQLEGAPAAIDVLPAIVAQVGNRATVLFDSGVRSGLDVVRAVALGAAATFAGRAFMYGLAALGQEGAQYVIDLLIEEMQAALRQVGARSPADTRSLVVRHGRALTFPKPE